VFWGVGYAAGRRHSGVRASAGAFGIFGTTGSQAKQLLEVSPNLPGNLVVGFSMQIILPFCFKSRLSCQVCGAAIATTPFSIALQQAGDLKFRSLLRHTLKGPPPSIPVP